VRRSLDALYRVSGVVAAACLALIAGLVLAQIVGRVVGVMLPGADDLASYALVATSFLALAYTLKSGGHIRVALLLQRLPARPRRYAELGALAVGSAITLYFVWFAIELTWLSWRFGDMSQGVLPIPLWLPQSVMTMGLIILAIALIDELVLVLKGGLAGYQQAEIAEADAIERRLAGGE
jgi:TRAP-type C4-dicarboxylate transport system permease small subunit